MSRETENYVYDIDMFENITVLGRRLVIFLHTASNARAICQPVPLILVYLGLFTKHSLVTDVNHVTFWPRDIWDDFHRKVARVLNE